MAAQLYRMRKEGTQFSDFASGWTLAWPSEAPPQLKPLPKVIGSALQNRLDGGSIIAVDEDEVDEAIVSDAAPADVPLIGGTKLGNDGKVHPDHVAAFKVNEVPQAQPSAEVGDGADPKPGRPRPRARAKADAENAN